MSQTQKSITDKHSALCQKIASKNPSQISKLHNSIILVHLVNTQFGLQCIDREGKQIEFPENLLDGQQGVYKLTYNLATEPPKVIQFRLVDNEDDGSVSVNYSKQNQDVMYQYDLAYEDQRVQEVANGYMKHLDQKLGAKKQNKEQNQAPRLQPVWRQPRQQAPRNPYPIQTPNRTQPFDLPFQGSEYIGPQHQLFQGRTPPNPYSTQDPNFNPSMMRPPGARYDPVDPFNSRGMDEHPDGPDFYGFNQFGQPLGGRGGRGGRGGMGGMGGMGGFNPDRFM